MTKLLIGLGLLIIFGALFGLLSALKGKLLPEGPPVEIPPAEPEEPEERRTVLRAVVH